MKKTSCEICGKKMNWDERKQRFVAKKLAVCECGKTHCAECSAGGKCADCHFEPSGKAEIARRPRGESKTTTVEDRVPEPSGKAINRPKRTEDANTSPKMRSVTVIFSVDTFAERAMKSIDDLNRAMWHAEKQDGARAAVVSMAPVLTSIVDLLIEGIAERRAP